MLPNMKILCINFRKFINFYIRRCLGMKFNIFTLFLVQARCLDYFSRTIWILSHSCVLKPNKARFCGCLVASYRRRLRRILQLSIKLRNSTVLGHLWIAYLSSITEARCLIIRLMLNIRIVLCNSWFRWAISNWLCYSSY